MRIVIPYAYYYDGSYYINYCYYSLFAWCLLCWLFAFGRFSFFMFWIKLCVPSWSSTLTCRYGTRLMKNPCTFLWQLSWTCQYYLFQCLLGCACAAFGVLASRSPADEFVKKEYILNKNIVHLIEDISGLCLKNPTQADRVIKLTIFIMLIMLIIVIVYDYAYYAD